MVIEAPPFEDNSEINHRPDWWNRPRQGLDYAQYKVGDTVVMVGGRPNFKGTTPSFYEEIKGYMNVSDRFVRHRADKLNVFYPWNEGGIPTYETIFSVMKTLHYWIDELKLPRVYIHCDGGTHRAVTMFGFFLLAYHKETAEKINSGYELVGRPVWSNPLEYARSYFKDIPAIQEFLALLPSSVDDYSHGDSFDSFLKEIGEETFRHYYRERLFTRDLRHAWVGIKLEIKFFIRRNTIGRIQSIERWVHKKLNTKKGKTLKRLGL